MYWLGNEVRKHQTWLLVLRRPTTSPHYKHTTMFLHHDELKFLQLSAKINHPSFWKDSIKHPNSYIPIIWIHSLSRIIYRSTHACLWTCLHTLYARMVNGNCLIEIWVFYNYYPDPRVLIPSEVIDEFSKFLCGWEFYCHDVRLLFICTFSLSDPFSPHFLAYKRVNKFIVVSNAPFLRIVVIGNHMMRS